MFILTLLVVSDIIQLCSKQQMLYTLPSLPFQVNHQKFDFVG